MMLILTLLLASALVGLVIGPRYNAYMLIASSLAIGLVSATATRLNDFDLVDGTAITFACITISQLTYLLVTRLHVDARWSADHPRRDGSKWDGAGHQLDYSSRSDRSSTSTCEDHY
jgi:hypothetical protein